MELWRSWWVPFLFHWCCALREHAPRVGPVWGELKMDWEIISVIRREAPPRRYTHTITHKLTQDWHKMGAGFPNDLKGIAADSRGLGDGSDTDFGTALLCLESVATNHFYNEPTNSFIWKVHWIWTNVWKRTLKKSYRYPNSRFRFEMNRTCIILLGFETPEFMVCQELFNCLAQAFYAHCTKDFLNQSSRRSVFQSCRKTSENWWQLEGSEGSEHARLRPATVVLSDVIPNLEIITVIDMATE